MKNQDSTPFGKRLQKARKDAGFTQQSVAKKIGMSQGTLAELERDGQGSSYTPALAALYGVDPLYLATGKVSQSQKENFEGLALSRKAEEAHPPPTPKQLGELILLFMKLRPESRETVLQGVRAAADEDMEQRQQDAI